MHDADKTTLVEHQYITLILRLTLDARGQLIHGELVDTMRRLPSRFAGAAGLHQAVAAWLLQQEQATDSAEP